MTTSNTPQGSGPAPQTTPAPPRNGQDRPPGTAVPAATPSVDAAPPRRRVWLWAIGVGLAAAAGMSLYLQPWATAPALVVVETSQPAPVTRVLAVNGRIAARQSVDVRALVGGAVTHVRVAEGDSVQVRAELAGLDSAAQQALLRQTVAGLDAALVAQSQARANYARTQALGENVARTTLESAERAVQSADQDVARTTALVDQAQVQLEYYTIRAPMTGTVLSLNVDPGQSIDPSTVLMTVADLGQLIVETDVDEAYAVQIRTGQPTVLQLAGEGFSRDGQVSRVSQRVDAATGGLAVQITFDEPVSAPVGLTVTANVIVDSREAALTAPRAAIQPDGRGHVVFVVVDGVAQRRAVSVIDWPAARLIVTDGLQAGDRLITDATGITDGQPVRVAQP